MGPLTVGGAQICAVYVVAAVQQRITPPLRQRLQIKQDCCLILCPVSSSPSCSVTMPKKSWSTSSRLVSWESLFYWVFFTWLLGKTKWTHTAGFHLLNGLLHCGVQCSTVVRFKRGRSAWHLRAVPRSAAWISLLFTRAQGHDSLLRHAASLLLSVAARVSDFPQLFECFYKWRKALAFNLARLAWNLCCSVRRCHGLTVLDCYTFLCGAASIYFTVDIGAAVWEAAVYF